MIFKPTRPGYCSAFSLIFAFLVYMASIACATPAEMNKAVNLLNTGDLASAEGMLRKLIEDSSWQNKPVTEAEARKWMAVTLGRFGSARFAEATNEVFVAEGLLKPKAEAGDKEAKRQLGYVLFDKAELLRTEADRRLREMRLSGAQQEAYFSTINEFISPAEQAITEARKYYEADGLADLDFGQAEINLLLARLTALFLPGKSNEAQYEKARELFLEILNKYETGNKNVKVDTAMSAGIRVAETYREQAHLSKDEAKGRDLRNKAIGVTGRVLKLKVPSSELTAYAMYLGAISSLESIKDLIPTEQARVIEAEFIKASEIIEKIRVSVSSQLSMEITRSFFSPRTHIYEGLVSLYSRTGEAEKMLKAVEKMKARALRDMLRDKDSCEEIDVSRICQRLKNERAGIVEFFYGPDKAWTIIILPDGTVKSRELPISGQKLTEEIKSVFDGFRSQSLLKRYISTLRRTGANLPQMENAFMTASLLYDQLLRPLTNNVPAGMLDRLYIVPHHLMNYLPFNALVTSLDTNNLVKSRFYVEDGLPITLLPSASSLLDIPEQKVNGQSAVFARSDFTAHTPTYQSDLPNAVAEAKMAATILSVTPFLEGDATESNLRKLKGSLDVLYFATHGLLDPDNPWKSNILLCSSDKGDLKIEDGFLTVEELMTELRGRLKAELVVLSACLTNRGDTNPASGDDIVGLSRAFLVSGARSVLATQWEASDDTFPDIMKEFLTSWHNKGQPKDLALQTSQRMFLSKPDIGLWRHPMFWAPVVLVGEAD